MRRRIVSVILGLAAMAIVVGACTKVPITGRRQYNLIPEKLMIGLGQQSWKSALAGSKVERQGPDATTLKGVGKRISIAAAHPEYDWRYALFESEQINAWCLPGGYIGFYSGILPVLKNEAGMAFVMGHEVGHAVARHGAERLSQQLTLFGGLAGLYLVLDAKTELTPAQRDVVLGAIGLGAEVGVLLPFSRTHESESDVIGLMFMSSAGYPPGESLKVWDRMDTLAGKSMLPAFLSTHPTSEKRQANLKEWMARAKKRYDRSKHPGEDTLAAKW